MDFAHCFQVEVSVSTNQTVGRQQPSNASVIEFLPEDPGSIPSTYMTSQTVCNSSFRGSDALFPDTHVVQRHTLELTFIGIK